MRILVVGSGGREHALCWKIAASPLCQKLYCLPGNAGIAEIAECISIEIDDQDAILDFVEQTRIDFIMIGPEAPLVAGLSDRLRKAGKRVFGPSAAAARLEGSKGFMKDMAMRCGIPTAKYLRTRHADEAVQFAQSLKPPVVIKADGLAAGKGVVICQSQIEVKATIDDILVNKCFGEAGQEIIVEEFLEGEELSFFALSDGQYVLPFGSAQDHKNIGEGDKGPNTGGMGAYSPAPIARPEIENYIMEKIIHPMIKGMNENKTPFIGVLFAGIMITADGPKLLEFNVRFGDPECEVLCLRLKSDLLPILLAASEGILRRIDIHWHEGTAIAVIMSVKGYPNTYSTGSVIENLDSIPSDPNLQIFHAGTRRNSKGQIVNQGGRVLAVSALGKNLVEARKLAYGAIEHIHWPDGYYRKDIGWRALSPSRKEQA